MPTEDALRLAERLERLGNRIRRRRHRMSCGRRPADPRRGEDAAACRWACELLGGRRPALCGLHLRVPRRPRRLRRRREGE